MEKADLATRLQQSGILAAITKMGMDKSEFVAELVTSGHYYDRYRWSVALGEDFREVVHAVPPEEEVGWTPWERWQVGPDGRTAHACWVAAPYDESPNWAWRTVHDDHSAQLRPLFTHSIGDLRSRLSLARVDEAFAALSIDINDVFGTIDQEAFHMYEHCRWAVIPHFLADHGPVVYSIPKLTDADRWPWETWYSDAGHQIHHAHFGQSAPGYVQEWSEPEGAPQRPPEVLGRTWFWGDAPSMALVMSDR